MTAGGRPEALDIIHPLTCRSILLRNLVPKCFCERSCSAEADFNAGMAVQVDGIDETHFAFLKRHDQRMSARAVAEEIDSAKQSASGDARARKDDFLARSEERR